jgi:hypothetical protein
MSTPRYFGLPLNLLVIRVYIYKYIHRERDAVHFVPPSSHYTSKNLRWKLENWMQTDELQLGYGLFNLGYPAKKMCD